MSKVDVSMNGIELQDREFFAAIREGREPNSSVALGARLLPGARRARRKPGGAGRLVVNQPRMGLPKARINRKRVSEGEEVAGRGTMAKLDSSLAEAEQVYREMRALADSGDTEGKKKLVQLRSRYAMLMLDILQARKVDERMLSDTELAKEFDSRFFEMRQALANHQAKWRLQSIEDDTAGYMVSAQGLNRAQDEFYHWARGKFTQR